VYTPPHEDSAEGVAVIDRACVKGDPIERLRMTFAAGRVVKVEADSEAGVEAFSELLSASTGDRDAIAEFAIGLNPGVTEPVGDITIDEKIGGSVHIAIGMNGRFGGRNHSNLHLDLVMLRPYVELDDAIVVAGGVLQVPAPARGICHGRPAEGMLS
jgi:aminopeptidase